MSNPAPSTTPKSHGTFLEALRGLSLRKVRLEVDDEAEEQEKQEHIAFLLTSLERVKKDKTSFIDPSTHADLAIVLTHGLNQEEQPNGMGPFFCPMSAESIQRYPVDMDNERTAENVRCSERAIDIDDETHVRGYPASGLEGRIEVVCSYITYLMLYGRKPNNTSLERITGWRHE